MVPQRNVFEKETSLVKKRVMGFDQEKSQVKNRIHGEGKLRKELEEYTLTTGT